MSRSRPYSIEFTGVSVSAVQDLLTAYCGASMAIEVHGVVIGQITGTTVQNLKISIKRLPTTVTAGSGGSAPTPQPMMAGDVAATFTARTNDTVQATTNGTASLLHEDVFNTVNGYQFFFPPILQPTAKLSQAIVISLDTAPSSAMTMSGTLYVAELF